MSQQSSFDLVLFDGISFCKCPTNICIQFLLGQHRDIVQFYVYYFGQVPPACDGWLASLMKSHMQVFPTHTLTDGHFQWSDCVGKKYYVINTIATSATDPFGTQHVNHQTQRALSHQKSTTDGAWPAALRACPGFFMRAQAGCLETRSQRSVTDELSLYSSLENVSRVQQWNMITQEQWGLKPTFYYA